MYNVKTLKRNKKKYLDLLLLADEEEKMIDRYINESEVFVLEYNGEVAGQCAVLRISEYEVEIKNIAVYEKYQNKGFGRKILDFVFEYYKNTAEIIFVGTGDSSFKNIKFYEKVGFQYSHKIKNFFTDNYKNKIFENGVQCIDMIYLKKTLK